MRKPKTMKVRQEEETLGGFGGERRKIARVIELSDDAELPKGAVRVPDETVLHDWKPVED